MRRQILRDIRIEWTVRGLVLALAAAVTLTASRADAPKKEPVQDGGAKKSDAVVKASLKAEPDKPGADGQQVVTVTLTIDKGWHIYANPVGQDGLAGSATAVKVTAKEPPVVKVTYPPGKLVKDKDVGDYKVYEDTVAIKATVQRTAGDKGPLGVEVKFQACNDKSCLLPATIKLTVP